MSRLLPLLACLGLLLGTACPAGGAPSGTAGSSAAGTTAPADAPTIGPHPDISALPTTRYSIDKYGVEVTFPEPWAVPEYSPDANAVFQLRIGDDTYFQFGFLPQARSRVAEMFKDLEGQELDDTVMEEAIQSVTHARNYFLGTTKTTLNYARMLFGEQDVLGVTMLIERPTGVLELIPGEEREMVMLSQQHYFDLAPEGSRRLTRHYVWLVDDDLWIAQVVAPPETFLRRATEVEEVILPSLVFHPRPP